VWYAFRSFPELELVLTPSYNGDHNPIPRRRHSLLRGLADRLLRLGEGRLRALLRRNLVYPNMADVPVSWLDPILVASQPPRDA
jgi:hypothetical protein